MRRFIFFQLLNFANENEAPEGEVTCLTSHSQGVTEAGRNLDLANSQDIVLSPKRSFATILASLCSAMCLMSLPRTAVLGRDLLINLH